MVVLLWSSCYFSFLKVDLLIQYTEMLDICTT